MADENWQKVNYRASTPRYYFWKSFERYIAAVEPKTFDIIDVAKEEIAETKRLMDKSFKFRLSAAIFILSGVMVFTFRVNVSTCDLNLFNKFGDSHSFDNLRSVKLVSWKTGASEIELV